MAKDRKYGHYVVFPDEANEKLTVHVNLFCYFLMKFTILKSNKNVLPIISYIIASLDVKNIAFLRLITYE